jgi:hypothetical protein
MLPNLGYRRQRRRLLAGSGAIAVAVSIVGLAQRDPVAVLIGPWFLLMVIPVAYGQQWMGSIYAQPQLTVEASGIRYGERYEVPWSMIEGSRVRRQLGRKSRITLLAPRWRPRGFAWFLERHRGLPLSDYDDNWRENQAIVVALRTYLPQYRDQLGI